MYLYGLPNIYYVIYDNDLYAITRHYFNIWKLLIMHILNKIEISDAPIAVDCDLCNNEK